VPGGRDVAVDLAETLVGLDNQGEPAAAGRRARDRVTAGGVEGRAYRRARTSAAALPAGTAHSAATTPAPAKVSANVNRRR